MVEQIDVPGLARRCQEETDRYLRGEAFSERFCFELFRRAIVERVDAAWAGVYAQYSSLVRIWLKTRMDEDEGVNAAFERFWHAVDAAKFARFGSLAAVLSYLKMCVHTTVLDHARAQRQNTLDMDLDTIQSVSAPDSVEGTVGERLAAAELWRQVSEVLTQEAERRVIYLSYVVGLTPREIQARHGREFPRVDEIYRYKRSALDHLRHSPALHTFIAAPAREGD